MQQPHKTLSFKTSPPLHMQQPHKTLSHKTQNITMPPALAHAATTQKPQCVIDVISHYYSAQNANVHRGSHSLTANATSQFEAARETVAKFVGASSSKEIIC